MKYFMGLSGYFTGGLTGYMMVHFVVQGEWWISAIVALIWVSKWQIIYSFRDKNT